MDGAAVQKMQVIPNGVDTEHYASVKRKPHPPTVALIGRGKSIRGYLNATPRQGSETLANWPSFRIEHLREDDNSKDVRLISSAHGLGFRSGRGSCVIDSYRTTLTRYREIACLVAGPRTSSVIVGAAPSKTWARQAATIQRAIASLRTD